MADRQWQLIPWDRDYQVSRSGEIRYRDTKEIIEPKQYSGYKVFKYKAVHRIVAEVFIGPCPEGYVVDHLNREKLDNRVENLEYVTPSENSKRKADPANANMHLKADGIIADLKTAIIEGLFLLVAEIERGKR